MHVGSYHVEAFTSHSTSIHTEYKEAEIPQYKAVIKRLTDWVCNKPDLTIKQTYYRVSLPDGSSTRDVTCIASECFGVQFPILCLLRKGEGRYSFI